MTTKLVLDTSGTIELSSDISISLNYSIAELQNIEEVNGSFSKTITVPGTKNNNKLLGQLFEVGITTIVGSYNTNVLAPCSIEVDNVTVMRGNMRIARIRIKDDNVIEYDLEVTGQTAALFTAIGDDTLTDLDFSEYDHLYNFTNITNSWGTSIKRNGVDVSFELGRGYVYPLVDQAQDASRITWDSDKMQPSLYVKTIWDALFKRVGFTYESSFLTSDFFKRLIFLYSGDSFRLSTDTVQDRFVKASTNVDYTYTATNIDLTNPSNVNTIGQVALTTGQRVRFHDDSTGSNRDNLNQWNTATSGGIVNASGYYNLSCQVEYSILNPPAYAFGSENNDVIMMYLCYSFTNVSGEELITVVAGQHIYAHEFSSYFGSPSSKTFVKTISNFFVPANTKFFIWMVNTNENVPVNPSYPFLGGTTTTNYNVKIFSDSWIKMEVSNVNITPDILISMESVLPEDFKCSDFFKGVVKMFNLYIEVDKDNSKNLIIDPRNDFYTSGTTVDWSSKLDRITGLEISPNAQLDNREYEWKYKQDVDNFNKRYQDKWFYTYSRRLVKVVTDLFKSRKTVELPFAATPCVGYNNSDRVLPTIFTNNNGVISTKKIVPRILYYGGLKSCNPNWVLKDIATTTTTSYNNYPYAGMVDDPYNPTVSLDFGMPNELYWTTLNYTNNNLFNKYYKEMVDEMTDVDGKIVSGSFRLTTKDMATFDFRNKVYLDGIMYRVNKITDYNPVVEGLTKVELIKIKKTKTFAETVITVDGSYNIFDDGNVDHIRTDELIPIRGFDSFVGDNVYPEMGQRVGGTSNFVDADSSYVEIIGNLNNVSDSRQVSLINSDSNAVYSSDKVSMVNTSGSVVNYGSQNISIVNSSGIIIGSNVRNVSVVNTSGVTVDTSNTIVKSNVFEVEGQITTGGVRKLVAIVGQSGTNAPQYVAVENTIGAFTSEYVAVGSYRFNFGSAVLTDNTTVEISGNTVAAVLIASNSLNQYILIKTYDLSTHALANSLATNTTLTVKVYP